MVWLSNLEFNPFRASFKFFRWDQSSFYSKNYLVLITKVKSSECPGYQLSGFFFFFQSCWLEQALFPVLCRHHVLFRLIFFDSSCPSLTFLTQINWSIIILPNTVGDSADIWSYLAVYLFPFWYPILQTLATLSFLDTQFHQLYWWRVPGSAWGHHSLQNISKH